MLRQWHTVGQPTRNVASWGPALVCKPSALCSVGPQRAPALRVATPHVSPQTLEEFEPRASELASLASSVPTTSSSADPTYPLLEAPTQPPLQQQRISDLQQDVAASASEAQQKEQKTRQFVNRVVFGVALGLLGGAVVAVGSVPFLLVVILVTYQATREYYGFITSKGIAKGMAPPPPLISVLTTVLCTSIALVAYIYHGRSGTVLAVAAFLLLVLQVVASKRPKFAQLASSLFGLFYCGWLPSFWVKLRMLSAPAPLVPFTSWITSFASWNVGLVVTFTTVACVIAADTGAYFVGKNLGRTKLTDISPKKTVEGAAGGLASSIAAAVGLWKITKWPATPLAAAGLGVLVFFCSLFGDLIESIMKRDAGMKDSGDLIPGHGGLLDRIDSYMFTGAVTYFYVVFILPGFGLA